jgi:hypothetical protein
MLFLLHLIWKIADSEFVLKWASNKTNEMPLEKRMHSNFYVHPRRKTVVYFICMCAIGRGTWQKNKLATPHAELRAQDASKSFGAAHGPARLTSSPLSKTLQLGKGERVCATTMRVCTCCVHYPHCYASERESVSAVGLTWASDSSKERAGVRHRAQMGWKHILIGGGRARRIFLIKKRPHLVWPVGRDMICRPSSRGRFCAASRALNSLHAHAAHFFLVMRSRLHWEFFLQ